MRVVAATADIGPAQSRYLIEEICPVRFGAGRAIYVAAIGDPTSTSLQSRSPALGPPAEVQPPNVVAVGANDVLICSGRHRRVVQGVALSV